MAKKYWWEENNNTTQAGEQPQNQKKKTYWWEPENIAATVGDDIINRLKTWIDSGNAYLADYKNRFSNRNFNNEDAYVSDSAEWFGSFKSRGESLDMDAQSISDYVDQYKDYLSADFVKLVKEKLGSTREKYGQLIEHATKDNEYWSQWETEDDYKSYLEAAKNREALLSYDLGAGAKEIEGLRRSGDHYSTVSNLYTNYLNGLIEVYEPEKTETPEEDYIAYEGYNPNAFEYEYDENGRLVDSVENKYQIKGRYITKDGLDRLVSDYTILKNKYGYYGDLADTINEKELYYTQAERAQNAKKLASVSENADFNAYSGYDRANKDDFVYEIINGNKASYTDIAISQAWGTLSDNDMNRLISFGEMNETEVGIYNYYYAKEGKDAAEKYLDSIQESLNYRRAESMAEEMEGNYLEEILFQAAVGLDQFSSGIKGMYNAIVGNDEYVPVSSTQIAGGMAREDLANFSPDIYNFKTGEWVDAKIFGNSVGQIMADATSTTFNMLPSVLTSTAVNFVAPGVGSVVGTTLLGASAGGNAYQEMINLGYSKGQARNYAVLVGGSEAILQYALGGISSLGGGSEGIFQSIASKWLPHVDNAFARVAIKLGGNMLDEGLEEGIQEILTPWFKNLTLNTNEKVNWSDVAYSTLLGSLTAGFMEGITTINGEAKTYNTGKKLQAAGISAERLAEIGSTFSADTVAYQLAGKVNENTGAYTMGRLFNEIGATLTTQNVNEITTELMKRGMDAETAKANAEAFAAVIEGKQLNDQQIAILEANDVLAGAAKSVLIDANTTWNQRAKGYNDALMSLANEMTSRKNAKADKKAAKVSKAKQATQAQENVPVSDTVDAQTETSTESLPGAESHYDVSADGKTIDSNGNDIIITGVESVKDGKIMLKTENGTIDASDVSFATKDEAFVYSAISNMDISPASAWALIKGFNKTDGVSAQVYAIDIPLAYKYGKLNYKAGLQKLSLTPGQSATAFQMGRSDAAASVKSQKNASTESTVSDKNADKEIIFEGFTYSKRKANPVQRASMEAIDVINKMSNLETHVYQSYKKNGKFYAMVNGKERIAPNGYFKDGNKIYIDINAGDDGRGVMLFTLAHEIGHDIARENAQDFKAISDFLFEHYGEDVPVLDLLDKKKEKLKKSYKADGKPIPSEAQLEKEALEELVCDMLSRMLADQYAYDKLMELKQKDLNAFQKLGQAIKKAIDKLAKLLGIYDTQNPDFLYAASKDNIGEEAFRQLQDMYIKAFVQADANYLEKQKQLSTDSIRGNADGAVAQSEVTTALVETTDGEILKSERTEYEALPKQVMSLSDGSGKLLNFIEGLVPTKLKGLSGRTTNGYTGRDVRAYAMEINGFTKAQIKEVNKFMDAMSEFMDKAGVTYKFIGLKDVKDAKLHYTYNADGSIKSIVLSAMVKNGDYPVNFDLSSICKKRVAMSKLIDKLATRGSLDSGTVKLTPANIFKINTALKNEGYETACLGCFVESKRYNSLEWAKTFCNKWNAAVKKVNPNATYFGYGDNTFNEDSFTLEQAVKVDEAATKYITTTKVERMANALKKYKAREQAGLPLVEKFSDAAKKRLVKSETISDELKAKYLNIDLTTLTMADVEFLLENEVLPGASLSNKQAVTEMVKSGEAYQHLLRPSDLLTDRGISKLEALPNFHGVLYGHYGSGTPKLMQSYTPYNSEIALLPANKNNDQTLAEYLYTIAGVRMQSFSDFQIQNIYDYLQMVADLAARKLPAHAYTKEISFAKLLGMTGIKVNLSVMFDIDPMVDKAHAGLTKLNKLVHRGEYAKVVLEDEQGKWVYNIGDYQTQKLFAEAFPDEAKRFLQSIGFGDAVKLQSTPGYSANCGIIGVGYSDLGIFAMLDDNRIRYIIPYHASSLPAEIKVATNISGDCDYTSYQNNMKIAGIVDKNGNAVNWSIKEAYKRLGSGQAVINELNNKVRTEGWVVTTKKAQTGHGTYGLYEDLQKTNDPRQTAGNFMDWCIGNGTLPLFYQFASHENYYKLLYDFNVYDCVTEEYAPQQAVTNTYPTMVDGQVQPGNVTDGGFDTEYFQGTIDKQMAFMDEYSRNLDEDLEELADNLEAGTKMSDRYSPEALFAKDPLAVATFPVKEVPTKRKKVNLPEVVKEAKRGTGSIVYAVDNEKPIIQSYVYISDIGSNVLVNTRGIVHGAQGNITNSSTMSTAEVEQVLPDVLRNSIAVNELSPRDEDRAKGIVKSYILFGYAKRADGKEYLVRSIINHFDGNKSLAESIAIYDVLKGTKAKKLDSVVIGSHTGNPAASHLNTAKSNFTISVKDLLDIVKENYPELLSDNFREYYGVTVPKADDLLFSDRDSEGNQLSAEQQEFFKDSKVRDTDGKLMVMYHGTANGGAFTVFDGNKLGNDTRTTQVGQGFYFTNVRREAESYTKNVDIYGRMSAGKDPHLHQVHLNITNPFDVSSDTLDISKVKSVYMDGTYDYFFSDWIPFYLNKKTVNGRLLTKADVQAMSKADKVSVYVDYLTSLGTKEVLSNMVRAFPYGKQSELLASMRNRLGYDGIVEEFKPGQYQYVAFSSEQIKNVDNTTPTADPDIRYQDRADESVSNRSLLANAFEGLAQNDIERNKIQEYKDKIELINAEEQKLSDLKQQIKELSFAKGPRDAKKIRGLQFEANQTANRINTYDKQLLRLEASKPLQDVLAREKKKAYEKAEKRGKEALDKYKERAAKTQRELLDRWQESRKKGIENREKTAMKHKIQRVVGELNQLLLNGDKTHHVPENLKKAVADALALVNMDTVGAEERAAKYAALIAKETDPDKIDAYTVTMENILRQGEKIGKRLKDLRDAYEEISESTDPDIANAYDPVIAGSLKELAQSIGDTSLKNMTIEQLQDVYDMYKMVLTRVRDANRSFLNEKREAISSLASRVVGEVKRVGGEQKFRVAFLDFVKKFGWDNLKPVYAFEHIGSGTLADIFKSVRAGEDTWAVDVTEAREYYLDKSKKYGYDSWDFKKQYHFKSASELEFDLTLEQILSLYAYSKREQAHDHLRLGGFVFDSNIETYKEKGKGGKSILKYKVNTADAHQITPEILANIISNLSDEQKSFVDEMQDYLSTVMGAKGNEVTMAMYGVKLFKEKFYFPLKSAKQFMFEQNEVSGEVKIKNSGFTNKVVVKANNPVILNNFMDVWAGHVNDMSMYHAFVLPLEDFNRVFNYNSSKQEGQPAVSVKGTIQNAYGPAAVGYVRQLITDLNGGARTDSTTGFINKMMGLFKKGSVFASLSVVVQQPSAIARAAALVDTKYFIGPKVDHKRHKALWDEVKQYAPVAIIKEMGYFDTNMGKSTQDFITAKEYSGFKEKMKALVTDSGFRDEALSKAPALADEIAWCSIWEAVKRETQAKNPNMDVKSEAFLKQVGDRFTEVIVKTQVYDSVLSRSGMMRSKDTGMKMATAFMAEPTTSINMIADALLKGKRGNKKYARAAIGAVLASQILNSILVSFVYAGRDDDEDKTYAEKYIGTLTGEIFDSLNPATYIPFIKDIMSIAQGYDVERSDMAIVSDLWKAWENLSNDNMSAYQKVENFAGSIAQIFGLPVKNIMRDARGIYQTIDSFVNGQQTTGAGIGYSVKSELPELFGGGDVSNKDQLYEAYLSGDSKQISKVNGRFKDQDAIDSAMRSAIKDRFESGDIDYDTAEEYLVEYCGMEKDDAYWKVQEWEYEMETGEDFHKFDDFYTAVKTGKNLKTVIKEYTDNGVEAKTLASQITSHFKPLYKEMSNTERAAIKGYLLNAYQLLGYNRSEKSKDIDNWLKD